MFKKDESGILKDIMARGADKATANMKALDALINSTLKDGREVSDVMSPGQLLNAIANYMEMNTIDKVDGYRDIELKLHKAVMTNPVFQQYMQGDEVGYFEIGLAMVTLGNRLIELETTEEEIVREKLDNGTFTKEHAEDLVNSNLRGLSDDLADRVNAVINGTAKEEVAASKVKVNDKNSMISLIKNGAISTPTLYILLESKEVTVQELHSALSNEEFASVMGDVNSFAINNGKKVIASPGPKKEVKAEEHECDCSTCDHADLCKSSTAGLNKFKEELVAKMATMAADETGITEDEKILRRAMDKGYVSDEDVLLAIQEKRLNPFYLEVRMKKENPERYAKISVAILKRNSPEILARLGEDPIKTIVDKIKSEK